MAVTANSMLDPQALAHGLAKTNTDVLRRMVRVDLQVAHRVYVEVNQCVSCEQYKHMV